MYPLKRGTFLGLPWPFALMPKSITHEAVDEQGRVIFDVTISLPVVGQVIHYQGWLSSVENYPPYLATNPSSVDLPHGTIRSQKSNL